VIPKYNAWPCMFLAVYVLQPVKAEIQFRVQPAYYELAGKITAELNQAVNVGHSECYAAASLGCVGCQCGHSVNYCSCSRVAFCHCRLVRTAKESQSVHTADMCTLA
jgi:hypothetical protein